MSLLRRQAAPAVERRAITAAPWNVGALGASSYTYVPDDAFRIAAVVACVGLRAGVFMQLPLKAYRDGPDGSPVLLPRQPALLTAPSATVVPSLWKAQMSISRDIWGYAVGKTVAFDGAGYPAQVEWLPPDRVQASQEFIGAPLDWSLDGVPLERSSVFHVPSRWVMPGNPLGQAPLERAGLVDLAKRAQDFGRDWFRNGAVPSQVLYSEQELTAEQADGMVERMTAKWRKRKPAVLGAGLKLDTVSVAANESQFLETIRQAAAEIALCFNVHPDKIAAAVSGSSVTYANREQNQQDFLDDSMNPDLVVVQEVITAALPRPQWVQFNTAALLRSDTLTKMQVFKIEREIGRRSINELRALDGYAPIDGGDSYEPLSVKTPQVVSSSAPVGGVNA